MLADRIAGFDTWDSAQRARRVFGVESGPELTISGDGRASWGPDGPA